MLLKEKIFQIPFKKKRTLDLAHTSLNHQINFIYNCEKIKQSIKKSKNCHAILMIHYLTFKYIMQLMTLE